jgi:hypothetical protein
VVFLGAGASVGAGLPTWKELIANLAVRAGLGDDLPELDALESRDAGRVLDRHLKTRGGARARWRWRHGPVAARWCISGGLIAGARGRNHQPRQRASRTGLRSDAGEIVRAAAATAAAITDRPGHQHMRSYRATTVLDNRVPVHVVQHRLGHAGRADHRPVGRSAA